MKKIILPICLALCALLVLAGCAGSGDPSPAGTDPAAEGLFPVTVTDSLGREVTLSSAPRIIVSLTPANTELLFALGAGGRVAGVDAVSDYPSEVADLPKVGDFSGPSVEAIVALKPDLVLAGNGIQAEAIGRLTDLGLTVAAIEASTWEQIPQTIETLGDLIGTPGVAADLNESMAALQREILDAIGDAPLVSVYYALSFGENGNWTTGPGTFIDTMIRMSRGESITHDAPADWLDYNMEDIVTRNPQIFLVSDDAGTIESFCATEGYKELDAVREGRVYLIDADIASRPGPRIMEGLRKIAMALHPECFD